MVIRENNDELGTLFTAKFPKKNFMFRPHSLEVVEIFRFLLLLPVPLRLSLSLFLSLSRCLHVLSFFLSLSIIQGSL